MICIYACLSTRPDIWCEVSGIAYSPASATFGINPAHLETSLPRVRSAAVTWITCCCLLNLLTFDEFNAWCALWKSVLETLKCLEIMYSNWEPICTLLMTRGVIIAYCICVSAWCYKTAVNNFSVWSILYNPPSFGKCTHAWTISSSTRFAPFSCGCCWFTETTAAQKKRRVFAFFWKSLPRNTSLFNAFFLTNCFISITMSSL